MFEVSPEVAEAINWAVGALGVPLVAWLIKVLKISKGKASFSLSLAVAVLISIGVHFALGNVDLSDFSVAALLPLLGSVYAGMQIAYNLLKPRE